MDLAESAVLAFSVSRCGGACKWRHRPDPVRTSAASPPVVDVINKMWHATNRVHASPAKGEAHRWRSGLPDQVTELSLASGHPPAAFPQPSLPQFASVRSLGRSARGAVQTDGLKPERRHARHAVCGPRIAESDARFGGAVVTPIWGSCGMALSATADAHAGRSGASSRGCLHRAPAQLAGRRGRRGRRPGSKVLPDARAAALNHAQCCNDATCASAKAQDYAAMVYARASSASFLTAGVAARRGEGRQIIKVRFSTIYN